MEFSKENRNEQIKLGALESLENALLQSDYKEMEEDINEFLENFPEAKDEIEKLICKKVQSKTNVNNKSVKKKK